MRKFTIACSAMLAAMATLTFLSAARASDDAQGVREANAQFYSALGAVFQGDMEPMNAVWSHEGIGEDIDPRRLARRRRRDYGNGRMGNALHRHAGTHHSTASLDSLRHTCW